MEPALHYSLWTVDIPALGLHKCVCGVAHVQDWPETHSVAQYAHTRAGSDVYKALKYIILECLNNTYCVKKKKSYIEIQH